MSTELMKKEKEFALYLDYPPFSTSRKKTEEYMKDCQAEIQRIFSLSEEQDVQMFSTVAAKWAEEINEARHYQKRYGDGIKGKEAAQKAAYEIAGRIEAIKNHTDEDVLLNFGFTFLED